jgi:effector-binding domain-containing protein
MYQIVPRTVTEQPTLVVRGKVCAEHIGSWLSRAYREIGDHAARAGVGFSGPAFALFRPIESELLEFEVEAGFPVASAARGDGTVESSRLPGGDAATTLHMGSYDTLAGAHEAVEAWIAGQGYPTDRPCWEVYYSDPISEPDANRWRTEIVQLYR